MIQDQQKRAEQIGRYLSGEMTGEERQALEQWINASVENRTFFEEMNSVWQITQPVNVDSDYDISAQWSELSNAIGLDKKPGAKLRVMYRVVAAAAAVALLIMAIHSKNRWMGGESNHPVLVSTEQTEGNRTIDLPDGSTVWLRQGSTISYDRTFDERNVELTGEAFFEVESDPEHPFTVTTGSSTVRVLGTRFNVRELPDGDVELYVEEGRVNFSVTKDGVAAVAPKLITRDQVAVMRLANREIQRLDKSMANITSWRSGILRFDGAPMDQVFRDLERYYRVEFEFASDALSTCTLKADFEAAPIEDVIETIEFSLGWQLERKNDVYYVKGSSCENAKE